MKLSHVIQAVYFSRWAITEPGWFDVHNVVQPHLGNGEILKFEAKRKPDGTWDESTDYFGNPRQQYELHEFETSNGFSTVAVVPVKGVLLHHGDILDEQCGACSYDSVKRDVNRALDEGASKIVLDMNTPGGMCMGCAETARVIAKAAEFVRVEAVTDGLMCSGGYWLASAAHAIYTTQTAGVGSIGVITAFMDQSKRYEMAGVKPVLFTSGNLKGTGYPGTSLSEAQAEHITKDVLHYFGMFKESVLENHPLIEDDSMRGQSFSGDQALEHGLIDGLVEDIEERLEPWEG
jgi:capsid assembly protease